MTSHPTVAFLAIGNEVLSGRTREGNLQILAQKLAPQGLEVREARVVSDQRSAIVAAVRDLGTQHSFVFTSGGIGPTHDDISAAAIAAAFNTPLQEHPAARALLRAHYGTANLTPARLKMAQVPAGARLIENPVSKAPGFWVENVLALAGVPKIFAAQVESVLPFLPGGTPVVSGTLVTQVGESLIADLMADVEGAQPGLSIGSYPYFRPGAHGTSIVVRSRDLASVTAAMATLRERLTALGHPVEDQGIQRPEDLAHR